MPSSTSIGYSPFVFAVNAALLTVIALRSLSSSCCDIPSTVTDILSRLVCSLSPRLPVALFALTVTVFGKTLTVAAAVTVSPFSVMLAVISYLPVESAANTSFTIMLVLHSFKVSTPLSSLTYFFITYVTLSPASVFLSFSIIIGFNARPLPYVRLPPFIKSDFDSGLYALTVILSETLLLNIFDPIYIAVTSYAPAFGNRYSAVHFLPAASRVPFTVSVAPVDLFVILKFRFPSFIAFLELSDTSAVSVITSPFLRSEVSVVTLSPS